MKKIAVLFIMLLSLGTAAQDRGAEKRERIKALKTAFITTELSLTPEEAAKFWPVYNAYEEKQFELRHEKMRSAARKLNNLEALSDKEALAILNQIEDYEEELYQNKKKLMGSLKSIISPVKIIKLKRSEDNFQRRLLRQYKHRDSKN
ncbi:MAG TPA: sensor of ECF-type sigma factor [Flavobacterium sp.]|nr:sensor of ECF-type sigma factor [Flavobacterium sp.]